MADSRQHTITPETSSGEGLDEEPSSRGEAKWKRFHPFRVVRKIFRRRVKREGSSVGNDASKKSWSTSELQSVQDDGAGKCEVTSPLKIGLSVSHDSIFSPESNSNVSGEELNVPRGSSLSVRHTSIKNMFKDELFTRVRARRDSDEDDDDDDVGLPHSPCTSPTTVDVLSQGLKEKSSKYQTTCSAGSLISMGSSENDDDSAGHSSGHSSRMSLLDRRSLDSEGELELSQPAPLNHNAAHHKIAVRPKRTYGLPRRRMNQIAASKVTTLPSTPEVLEDNGKSFQNFEPTKASETVIEPASSGDLDMTVQSVDWQYSHVTSTSSYRDITTGFQEMLIEDSHVEVTELSQVLRTQATGTVPMEVDDEEMKWKLNETQKTHEDILSPLDGKECNSEEHIEKKEDIDEKNVSGMSDVIRQSFESSAEMNIMESIKLVKNVSQSIVENGHLSEDAQLKEPEAQLSVASLIKNIERSDSFKSDKTDEKIPSKKGLTEKHDDQNDQHKGLNDKIKPEDSEKYKLDFPLEEKDDHHDTPKFNIEVVRKSSLIEKLDTESEFILKPTRKDLSSDSASLAHRPKVTEKLTDEALLPTTYSEEESIMSDKALAMEIEENRIFISHHASFSNDLKDILVTEAHNFAAVEDKAGISVQTPHDRSQDVKKEKINESWVSSVGISSVRSTTTDVTVNSLTSNICDEKMLEDRVTISVNSLADEIKPRLPSGDRKRDPSPQKAVLPPKPDVNAKYGIKDKQASKSANKSHLPEGGSSVANAKTVNVQQKRVSVEIVPFSQRMKERKYQPISFTNKESSDSTKKTSNSVVERKLSDRKIVTKNKDSDKSNNRHSFSGALTTESKKETENSADNKVTKPEKIQYPVQIRIHKSIPKLEVKEKALDSKNHKDMKSSYHENDIKGKADSKSSKDSKTSIKDNTADAKFQMHSTKNAETNAKSTKSEKKDSSAKWEVKIQTSAQVNMHSTEEISQTNVSKSEHVKPPQQLNLDKKDIPSSQEPGSPTAKSRENSWKASKDGASLSDEPEPELLRVFARRSIKQKHCDRDKNTNKDDKTIDDTSSEDSLPQEKPDVISVSEHSTVIKISETTKSHISKPDLIKKKSKSFSEKEKLPPRSVSPLKEMNLIHKPPTPDLPACIETIHPRQRQVSVPEVSINLPPDLGKTLSKTQNEIGNENLKEETLHRASSLSVPSPSALNGALSSVGMVKENQEILNGKEAHTPAWLQLAQQRRELREQRERLLLGGASNSYLDASSKPSRSSKVWDMVNNFQKLQMT